MARKEKEPKGDFPGQCVWLTGSKRCLLRGSVSTSTTGPNPSYCPWHFECLVQKSSGRSRGEFSEWLEIRRAVIARAGSGSPGGFLAWSEQELWEATSGEKPLAGATVPLANPNGIVSAELNEMVLGKGGLMHRVLDREITGEQASEMIAKRAAEIVRSREDESFG